MGPGHDSKDIGHGVGLHFLAGNRRIGVSLAGRSFTLEEEAYNRLNQYLEHYRRKLSVPELQKSEVMEEMEGRIAELLSQEIADEARVVTVDIVEKIAKVLGMPDGSAENWNYQQQGRTNTPKKLFRDSDNRTIAGVCSGLAAYLDVDVTLVRVVMLIAFILGSAGFWVYLILWIVAPVADTPAKKCEMHGVPPTAENMSHYYNSK